MSEKCNLTKALLSSIAISSSTPERSVQNDSLNSCRAVHVDLDLVPMGPRNGLISAPGVASRTSNSACSPEFCSDRDI